jgi:hypothetical protein
LNGWPEPSKADFPQLPILLLADALYANATVFDLCRKNRWDYLLTFKPGRCPELFSEFQSLKELLPQNRIDYQDSQVPQAFAWVNDLDPHGHRLSAFECQQTQPDGPHTFAWITNLPVGCKSVITLANQGGRLRWKIENEGFNIQKNHGYELEHAYSQDPWAAKNFYVLLQVAHAINQLILKGSLIGDFARSFGSIRNFLRRLAETLRNSLLDPHLFDPDAPAFQIRLDSS